VPTIGEHALLFLLLQAIGVIVQAIISNTDKKIPA